jgi:hypothetical protein
VVIETTDDHDAYTTYDGQSAHKTALPTHKQYVSQIGFSMIGGARTVSQYSHCSPPLQGRNVSHIVAVSPVSGFVAVRLQDGFIPKSGALPTTTGRSSASAVDFASLDADERAVIASQYTWEGKNSASGNTNDRAHPQAYRDFDEQFIASNFVAQGWRKDRGFEHIDPVIMKLASRTVTRK